MLILAFIYSLWAEEDQEHINEISNLLKKVGFKSTQTVATKMPINTQILLASR
jgi:hypothetical protein